MERQHGTLQKPEAGLQKRLMKFVGKLKSPGSPRRSSRSPCSSQRSSFAKESDAADADDESDAPSGASAIQPPQETAGSQFQPSVRASTESDWDVMGDGARSHGPSLEISPFCGEGLGGGVQRSGSGKELAVGTIEEEDREGEDLNGTWVARTADANRRDWKVRTAFSTTSQEHSTATRGSTDTCSTLSSQQQSINLQPSWAPSTSSPAWSPPPGGSTAGSTAGGTAGGTAGSTPRRKSATMSKLAARRVSADLARRIAEIQEHVAGLTENDMLDPNIDHLDKIKQLSHRPRHANTSDLSSDKIVSESHATSTANALGYNAACSAAGSPHTPHTPQSTAPVPANYNSNRPASPPINQHPDRSQISMETHKQDQEENSFLVKLQTKLFDQEQHGHSRLIEQESSDQHGVSGWDMPKLATPSRSPTQSNTSLPLMSALYAPGNLQYPVNSGQPAAVLGDRVSSVMSVGSAVSTTASSTHRHMTDSPTTARPAGASMLRNQGSLLDSPAGNSHASLRGSSFFETDNLMPFHPVAASMHQAAGIGSTGSIITSSNVGDAHSKAAGGYARALSTGVVDNQHAVQGSTQCPHSFGAATGVASPTFLPPAATVHAASAPAGQQAVQAVQAVQSPVAAGMPAWPTGGKQLLKMVHARSQGTQAVAHNVLAALRSPPGTASSTPGTASVRQECAATAVLHSGTMVSGMTAGAVAQSGTAFSPTVVDSLHSRQNGHQSRRTTNPAVQSAPLQYITAISETVQDRHGYPTLPGTTSPTSPARPVSMPLSMGGNFPSPVVGNFPVHGNSPRHIARPPMRRASMNDAGGIGMMQAPPIHTAYSNLSVMSPGMRSGGGKLPARRGSMLTVLPEDSQQIIPDVNMANNPLFPLASITHSSSSSNHGLGVGHIRSIQIPPPSAPASYDEHHSPLPHGHHGHAMGNSYSAPHAFFLMSQQSSEGGQRPSVGMVQQPGWAGRPNEEERVPDMVLDESGVLVPVPHHSFLSTTQSLGALRSHTDVSADDGNSSSRLQNQEAVPGMDGTGSGASQRSATQRAAPRRAASAESNHSAGSTYVWSRVQSLLDGLMTASTKAQQSRRGSHAPHTSSEQSSQVASSLLSPGMVGCLMVGVCFTLLLNTLVLLVALMVMKTLVNNQGTCRAA